MSFPEILETLLRYRGITAENRNAFLRPEYEKLYNPLLLPDMEKARDRVIEAMQNGEHIFVFSDYDADGIPGAVVLSDFFKRSKYDNVSFYIPHRHDEGFGLSFEAVEEALARKAKLIITVDCGTADRDEIASAQKNGIDVIVTDHHESSQLPKAFAVVNPKRKDSLYPFLELCGAALAFKLVQAVLEKETFGAKPGMEKWSLDMVGIATLSDLVPLVGENRILASFGLEVLKKSPRPGIVALCRKLGMEQKYMSEDDIAFMITPRVNAASRMGVPMDAFLLLSTTSQLEAERLVQHLEKINNERKGVVASIVKNAKEHLKARSDLQKVIVIGNPEWRPALLGLVANSLVEEYARPVFVWGRDGDGVIKGSCRTYNGTDLFELMKAAKENFLEFGGHKGAGGFSLTLEQVPNLEDTLSNALSNLKEKKNIEADDQVIALEAQEVCEELWKIVSQLAPFGVGNEKPVFVIKNASIASIRQFGKTGDHLEVILSTPDGFEVKCISFFSTPQSFSTPFATGQPVNLHAHLEKSYFRNRPELRLRIVDILSA